MIGYVRPQVGYVHSMPDMSGQQKFCAAKKLPRGGVNRQSNLKLT